MAKYLTIKNRSKSSRTTSAYFRSKYFPERLAILRARDFRLFYVGYSASLLGSAMSSVAIAFAVLGNGGTATGLGLVFAANIVPMVAFMLFGGALADRLGRRRVMLAADLVRGAAQAVLAAALSDRAPEPVAVRGRRARDWHGQRVLLACAFRLPRATRAARQARRRERAARLGPAGRPGRRPALAGILIAVTSPALVLAVDAGSYALGALALARLRLQGTDERQSQPARRARSLPRELAEGWSEFLPYARKGNNLNFL